MTRTTRPTVNSEGELDVVDRLRDRGGAVVEDTEAARRAEIAGELGQHRLDAVDHVDRVGVGLAKTASTSERWPS